jgi:hypothetical protein
MISSLMVKFPSVNLICFTGFKAIIEKRDWSFSLGMDSKITLFLPFRRKYTEIGVKVSAEISLIFLMFSLYLLFCGINFH